MNSIEETPTDFPEGERMESQLIALIHASLVEQVPPIPSEVAIRMGLAEKTFVNDSFIVALNESRDTLIGHIGFEHFLEARTKSPFIFAQGLYVQPELRGAHVSQLLMGKLAQFAKSKGVIEIDFFLSEEQQRDAIQYYRKLFLDRVRKVSKKPITETFDGVEKGVFSVDLHVYRGEVAAAVDRMREIESRLPRDIVVAQKIRPPMNATLSPRIIESM